MANRNPLHRRTKRLTVSAMLAALSVILLAIGLLFADLLDLSAAALASILCIYAVIELGGAYPWMIWAVASFLGLLLLPQKSPAFFYLFLGLYSILKEKLEKLPRLPSLLLKLAFFHVCLAIGWGLLCIFAPTQAILAFGWMLLATYALGLVAFLVYDYALSKLITFYLLRLRGRLGLK